MTGTVLITGGNGMVGRNLRLHPLAQGRHILAPSSRELDLRDQRAVEKWFAANKPDLVIHAAGRVGGIQANVAHPVVFLEENLTIGRNVVMEAAHSGVQRLINLGSTCIYPAGHNDALDEDMILTGALEATNEGYAIAKIAAIRLCQYIQREEPRRQFKTLIPCNLYGPHDKFDPERSHLVPAVIQKIHKAMVSGAEEVEIWGDGTARREFLYVGDLADAIWRAADDIEALPSIMNVGLGHDYSVNDYYSAIAEVVGWSGRFTHDLSRPIGMSRKLASIARLDAWGWRGRTTLQEGLAETYAFYRTKVLS